MPGIPAWVYAAIAAAIFSAGLGVGHKITSNAWKAEQTAVVSKELSDYKAEAVQENTAAKATEDKKDEVKVIYQTITKTVDRIIDRPIYRNVCFDDDGLRAANAALTGTAPDTSEPNEGVPKANPTR